MVSFMSFYQLLHCTLIYLFLNCIILNVLIFSLRTFPSKL